MVCYILRFAGLLFLVALTIWGSWTLAKLLISDWLRLASSCRRDSFCCSITLFSSSMDFRLDSIVVIWGGEGWWQDIGALAQPPLPTQRQTQEQADVTDRKWLTCVLSLIMSASTCELDSLKSLISSSSCLISSSCSSPVEEEQH